MAELRWILLAAGALLIIAIWWSGRRRSEADDDLLADAAGEDREEPGLGADAGEVDEARERVVPAIAISVSDRLGQPRSPPVVEIPADVEPELVAATPLRVPLIDMPVMRAGEPLQRDAVASGIRPVPARPAAPGEREPWVRTQPMRRSEVGAMRADAPDRPGAGTAGPATDSSVAASEPPQARQRIVALRVMSGEQRWSGADLISALQIEGLVFGKYSIFHRQREDGRSIYCLASMVEPGSFDLETIESQTFPGISLFAVLPGPLDAPTTFDQMLATARRLGERLGGNLQDEHDSSLTAQRILNLREELVHFDHLLARRPRKP
ncbi:MAG: cell division protein ZipA C-terminal FtsZ-binding domain-containing protein [Steroidobacteraceae bacterium]